MNLKEILSGDVVTNINNNMEYLISIIPEIKFMINFPHNHPHHHLDVWNHTLLALSLSEDDFEIRLVLLLHDIGKPFSYQDKEIRHFNGHASVSATMSYDILKRLNFDDVFINEVCYLIKNHDTSITNDAIKMNSDLAFKRYKIQYCDAFAHHPDKLEKRKQYLEKTLKKFDEINILKKIK